MKNFNSRSGSALLIVLGMLTFLIVSAVGFATYMRYGRLPSSQLRRTVSSRQLVKAATARAIDEIDQAINNNPHPNVGTFPVDGRNRNIWYGRVFTGTNIVDSADGGGSNSQNKDGSGAASYGETVSPLCLEALAYIPPVLINEARYYSRMTPTAMWKTFDFEAGRYAFMALDVSDYFDVNRLFANRRRSSAPNQRISLSYLFEQYSRNNDHNGLGDGADKWDEFMKDFRTVKEDTGEISFENTYPLISLADLNLAIGDKEIGGFISPFCRYLKNPGGNGFYNLNENPEADARLKRMTFVTDGLFPKTERKNGSSNGSNGNTANSGGRIYDLADEKTQPFDVKRLSDVKFNASALSETLMTQNHTGDAKNEWYKLLSVIGCVSLYDYLDADKAPLSIALPTVERFPMICGIQPDIRDVKIGVEKVVKPDGDVTSDSFSGVVSTSEGTRDVEVTVRYTLNRSLFQQGMDSSSVRVLTVFPFARKDDNDGKFELDGRMSLFFSSEEMGLRTGDGAKNGGDLIHLEKEIADSAIDKEKGLMNIRFELPSSPELKPSGSISAEIEAVKKVDIPVGQQARNISSAFSEEGNELLKVVYRWQQTSRKDPQSGIVTWEPSLETVMQRKDPNDIQLAATAFPALKSDGSKDSDFDAGNLKNLVMGGKELYLNSAFWFRVKQADGDKKVVDMVPACVEDDNIQNGVNASSALAGLGPRVLGGSPFPLLKFKTGITLNFSIEELDKMAKDGEGGKELTFAPRAAIVADPRYNYAPEEWFGVDQALSEDVWVQNNRAKDRGNGRDGDIFMSTSDSGYLQSIYELAFLPRLTDLSLNGQSTPKNFVADFNRKDLPASFEETRNNALAWRTYDPFRYDKEAFKDLPFVNEGSGFKVNPYSDSVNVMMAVFANTPLGWTQASTNKIEGMKVDYTSLDMEEFNKKYAFNAYSTDESAVIPWEVLEKVAENMIAAVKSSNQGGQSKDWEDVFLEDLGWDNTEENKFLGIESSDNSNVKLWGVDKKFLYGFWKDCFAVKQQLFLVFVRAEPTMMGSGASGHAPPQLGGKAVALVWRDPTPSRSATGDSRRAVPHKTRVLFYRQFE